MPGRLFYFLTVLIVIIVFMAVNLNNSCDISLVFYHFKDVPIFLSMMLAFVLGIFASLPFLFGNGKKKEKTTVVYPKVEKVELKKEKRSWFGKKKKEKKAYAATTAEAAPKTEA